MLLVVVSKDIVLFKIIYCSSAITENYKNNLPAGKLQKVNYKNNLPAGKLLQ